MFEFVAIALIQLATLCGTPGTTTPTLTNSTTTASNTETEPPTTNPDDSGAGKWGND